MHAIRGDATNERYNDKLHVCEVSSRFRHSPLKLRDDDALESAAPDNQCELLSFYTLGDCAEQLQ